MNEQDSLQMQSLLCGLGYKKASDPFEADLVLINTCSIRDKAENKIYSELGRLRQLKEDKPEMLIGVTGCVAEQEKEGLAKRFPFIDIIMGPDQIRHLPNILQQLEKEKKQGASRTINQTGFELKDEYKFLNVLPEVEEIPVKAFVNIQKGCDNFCAYCIVPYVRGREVSRSSQDIIEEIKQLIDCGVKEVTLLGQNVNSYGVKNGSEISFSKLLELISQKTDLKRLRFATSHPRDVSDDLIEQFAHNPILAPHFHLPMQSGSSQVLELMNRKYTREHYLSLVERLKGANNQISFSTDIIVGFPGETEQDFQGTLDVMSQVRFTQIYSFVYSPRPFTSAANLQDDVSKQAKSERLKILQEFDKKITLEQNQGCVGSDQTVLIETVDLADVYPSMGRTEGNRKVHFKSEKQHQPGDFVSVKIIQANPHSLFGNC